MSKGKLYYLLKKFYENELDCVSKNYFSLKKYLYEVCLDQL